MNLQASCYFRKSRAPFRETVEEKNKGSTWSTDPEAAEKHVLGPQAAPPV